MIVWWPVLYSSQMILFEYNFDGTLISNKCSCPWHSCIKIFLTMSASRKRGNDQCQSAGVAHKWKRFSYPQNSPSAPPCTFNNFSRERTTLWGSLKWLLCPNVSCPLTGSGPNLALNRGASCQGDTLPYSPQNLGHQAFQSIRPITNQKSRPKLETKSSILLLYLFEATLRAITTIACKEKLAT